MLKMYQRASHHGGTADYWEETWDASNFDDAIRFCDIDPRRPLFERYAPVGSRMLEGGCGPGYWVAYYGARGRRPVGVDFAMNPLIRLRRRSGELPLCAGDVGALPFRDQSFEFYYSGGVVEHFEAGCDAALKECRRVLRSDGVLLISVPYFSPLRRVLSWLRGDWKTVPGPRAEAAPTGVIFFQYAYSTREFERMLRAAGLRVRARIPYSMLWGLFELPGLRALAGRLVGGATGPATVGAGATPVTSGRPQDNGHASRPSLLKRLVISEDRSVPIAGALVSAAGWLFANMMTYECVRDDSTRMRGV